jgi:methylated-DNA-[protein]-cysteine S-methyltransferase
VGELLLDGPVLLWHELPRPEVLEAEGAHPLAKRLARYFSGQRSSFEDVELDLAWCTQFQRSVAEVLRTIPYGETVTYGELAALAGHPGAQRAAGTFCAGNRFPVLLPCHRVLAANGLGGYGSLGASYKRRLLELEGAR